MTNFDELIKSKCGPIELGKAMVDAVASGDLQEADTPSKHYFAAGLYGRATTASKDDVIVSQRHLQQHITVALKGVCTVVDEQGNKVLIEAPGVWITEPGTQRSIYCHTDVEWLTVHANPNGIASASEIEKEIAENPFTEYRRIVEDRSDYLQAITDCGFDEKEARELSERADDRLDIELNGCRVSPSLREGDGLFAVSEFTQGNIIAPARIGDQRTQAGRYTNHSKTPNAWFSLTGERIDLIATSDIHVGEEITVDYRQAKEIAITANRRLSCHS